MVVVISDPRAVHSGFEIYGALGEDKFPTSVRNVLDIWSDCMGLEIWNNLGVAFLHFYMLWMKFKGPGGE